MQDWLNKHGSKLKIKPDMTRDDIVKLVHQSVKDTQEVIDRIVGGRPILLEQRSRTTEQLIVHQ